MTRYLQMLLSCSMMCSMAHADLKTGAAVVDVTPAELPVLVNGSMVSRSADKVKTRVNARAIVIDGGGERLAIVVVDSCMMPRPLLDQAKRLAAQRTNIKPDRMLISATHSHTAPSSMGCLGTEADPAYVPFLIEKLADAIVNAEKNLEPAEVGWAVTDASELTALRRWVRRPDKIALDPFGNPTVRANMHAGSNWDDVTGESGPEDPQLSLISFRSTSGRPIAVLANFSMHYFSDQPLSADYFGLFAEELKNKLGHDTDAQPFVGIMSHGCSGDIWRRDYKLKDQKQFTIDEYANAMASKALAALKTVKYSANSDVAMAETRMNLKYRVPDLQRLQWAQKIVGDMGERLPKTREEVYAREQVILHERQSTEIVVQALRVGDIAIATTPNETYALTGLKMKLQSPLRNTMVIELANGGDGYIPPPEQHLIGGYNTWAARSAGLEVSAEPKITEAALQLLESVTGENRIRYVQSHGPSVTKTLAMKPAAYWRMDEFQGPDAIDSSGHDQDATYEPATLFFLEGPRSKSFTSEHEPNRSVHFAGDRMRRRLRLSSEYSVSMWIWNGMPVDARPVTGWMYSRGPDHGVAASSEHLGIGGVDNHGGKLIYSRRSQQSAGETTIERWTWNHVVLARSGERVRVYLNGNPTPEIELNDDGKFPDRFEQFFFGGRSDNTDNWEGRLDEIAVFDRALSLTEIKVLSAAN